MQFHPSPVSSTSCKLLCRRLQQGKSGKETSQNNGQSVSAADFKSDTSSLLSAAAAAAAATAASATAGTSGPIRVDCVRAVGGSGGCGTSGLGLVGSHGVLGTAKVVLLAVRLASVRGASILALDNPLCADEVGQAERILGNIWLHVVPAQAAIGQSFLRTKCVSSRALDMEYTGMAQRTGSQVLTRVVLGSYCWQIRGQVVFSDRHQ